MKTIQWNRYTPNNVWFPEFDAMNLADIILNRIDKRTNKQIFPKRIIEIGSGYSTKAILDAVDNLPKNKKLDLLVSIDPFLDRVSGANEPFSKNLKSFLITQMELFDAYDKKKNPAVFDAFEKLQAGDIVFIDGSHIYEKNSDVQIMLEKIMPKLPYGVIVHFHDIFVNFEYPENFKSLGWNEAEHLLNFIDSSLGEWEVLRFCHAEYIEKKNAEKIPNGSGSYYLLKTQPEF